MKRDNWKIWEDCHMSGEVYYKIAIGERSEMESAKALCKILKPLYKKRMRVLDVGCGVGHYLRTLRKEIDMNIDYLGVDITEKRIQLAKKAFKDEVEFRVGDIFNLEFEDSAFDIVICNNMILHLPPNPTKAIAELTRVSGKYVIIRTLFGKRNYIIKELRTADELEGAVSREGDIIDTNGEVMFYNYFNMYTSSYFKDIIQDIDKKLKIRIEKDNNFARFDNRDVGVETATVVVDGKQIAGNLILDWRFITLVKNDETSY